MSSVEVQAGQVVAERHIIDAAFLKDLPRYGVKGQMLLTGKDLLPVEELTRFWDVRRNEFVVLIEDATAVIAVTVITERGTESDHSVTRSSVLTTVSPNIFVERMTRSDELTTTDGSEYAIGLFWYCESITLLRMQPNTGLPIVDSGV